MKKYGMLVFVLFCIYSMMGTTPKCKPEEKTPDEQIDTVVDFLPTVL